MKQNERDFSQDKQSDSTFSGRSLKNLLLRLPATVREMIRSKAEDITLSTKLREERLPLNWSVASARTVYNEIEELLRRGAAYRTQEEEEWTASDRELAEDILAATSRAGISNITRTAAYLECYEACPELHWAFLAHMVSRNAGWNMTDLRGSRMSDVVDEEGKRSIYRFLERSNALIFQDAYPQLLLYRKSRELGASQFHLLRYFSVSRFMRPFWEKFWIDRGSALLTVGLIINEQNYIEQRIIRHPFYQRHVTEKMNFHLYSLSGLNQIILPLLEGSGVTRLAGRTVTDFGSLPARIALGKCLYAMLMGLRAVRSGAEAFARAVPHTGSRTDYWPEIFTANKEEALTAPLQGSELLEGETLPAGERLYSPKLLEAWGDTPYEPISREDWLKDTSALNGISAPSPPLLCDISREHRAGVLKTALAHDAVE